MTKEEAIKSLNEKGSPFAGGEAHEVIANGLSEEAKKRIEALNRPS